MSNVVDSKVVEMKFDNKDFETNVKTSMNSVEKLKRSLEFKGATKGLDNIDSSVKKINFNPMGQAVESVQVKFSALEVVAITALQHITNSAITMAENLARSLTIDQVTAAFSKYEEKTESVMTIMAATGLDIDTVNQNLEKLIWFSDETSYSFTDMVASIGKFTSAGLGLEESVTAMMGIANWAAVSGVNAQKATGAYYNLSQAIGMGSLKLQDWKSIELLGMATQEFKNTAIETAVELGKLKKVSDDLFETLDGHQFTNASFRESLSTGWFDTETMMATFSRYGEYAEAVYGVSDAYDTCSEAMEHVGAEGMELSKKAFLAAQQAKTFTDVIDATKDAVSSQFMRTFELLFGNLEEATELWTEVVNTMWDVFVSGPYEMNELLEESLTSNWSKVTKEVENTGIAVGDLKLELMETARAHGIAIDEMVEADGSFEKSLKRGWLTADIFSETIERLIGVGTEGSEVAKQATENMNELNDVVDRVINGDFGNGWERVEKLTEAGYDYNTVQDLVNAKLRGETIETLTDLSDAQLKSIGYTEEQIEALRALANAAQEEGTDINTYLNNLAKPSGRELIIDTIRKSLSNLFFLMDRFKYAWSVVFPKPTADMIYEFLEKMHDKVQSFTDLLQNNTWVVDRLDRTFIGLASIFGIFADIVTGVKNVIVDLLNYLFGGREKSLFKGFLDVTASVGDNIVAFREWLNASERIRKAGERIGQIFIWLKNRISDFFATHDVWGMLDTGISTVKNGLIKLRDIVAEFIKEHFPRVYEFLENIFEKIKENIPDISIEVDSLKEQFEKIDGISFSNILANLSWVKENILDRIFDFEKIGGRLSEFLQGLTSNVDGHLENLKGLFGRFTDKLGDVVDFVDNNFVVSLGTIAAIFLTGGLINAIKKFGEVLDFLATPIKTLANVNTILGNFANVVGEMKNVMAVYKIKIIAESIVLIAGAIAMLALFSDEQLERATGCLAVILTAVIIIAAIFSGKEGIDIKVTDAKGKAIEFAAIVGALIGMAAAMYILAKIDESAIKRAGFAMGQMVAILMLVMFALSKMKFSADLKYSSISFVAIAVSMLLVAKAMNILSSLKIQQIQQGIFAMVLIVGSMSILSAAASKLSAGAIVPLIGMSLAVGMFAFTLTRLAKIDINTLKKAVPVLTVIGSFMSIVLLFTRLAGPYALGAGVAMVGMAAGIFIIAKVMKDLGKISDGELQRGTLVIGAFLGMFALIILSTKAAGQYAIRAGLAITAISVALIAVAGALFVLSLIDPGKLAVATLAIDSILFMFSLIIKNTRNMAKTAYVVKAITALTVAIVALTACLVVLTILAEDSPEALAIAAACMAGLIGMFAVLVKVARRAKTSIPMIAVIVAALVAIGGILYILATYTDADKLIKVAVSLGLVMLSLAAVMFILSKSTFANGTAMLKSIGGLALLELLLLELGGITKLLELMKLKDNTINQLDALSNVLLKLVAVYGIVGLIGSLAPVGAISVGVGTGVGFGAFVAIIIGVIAGIGYISEKLSGSEFDLNRLLDSGIPILEKVATALGDLIGHFVGAFGVSLTADIATMGENLATFADNISPLVEMADKIGSVDMANTAENLKNFASIFIDTGFSELLYSIAGALSGGKKVDFKEYGRQLVGFATSMRNFSIIIGDIKPELMDSAGKLMSSVAEMNTSMPLIGTGFFGDATKVETYGTNLVTFAGKLVTFANTFEHVDFKAATAIKIQRIMDIVNGLKDVSTTGGVLGLIFGDSDLGKFGTNIYKFGTGIKNFATEIADLELDPDKAEQVKKIGDMFARLAEIVPASGGLLDEILGSSSLGKFGKNIKSFGSSMVAFSNEIAGATIDEEATEKVANCGTMLATLADAVPPENSNFVSFFLGDNSLTNFGENVKEFGAAMQAFGMTAMFFPAEAANDSVDFMKSMVEIAQGLQGLDVTVLGQFASNMRLMAISGMTSFENAFADHDESDIEAAVSGFINDFSREILSDIDDVSSMMTEAAKSFMQNINSLKTSFRRSGAKMIDEFISGINSRKFSARAAAVGFIATILSGVKEKESSFRSAGSSLCSALALGFKMGIEPIKSNLSSAMDGAVNSVRNYYQGFYNAGLYLVLGLRDGINDNKFLVTLAAQKMAQETVNRIKSTFDEHSPSKETYRIGWYAVLGLVNAFEDGFDISENAGASVAESAIDGFKSAIQYATEIAEDGIQAEPVIRPVLDLSDVEHGVGRLDSIMSKNVAHSIGTGNSKLNMNAVGLQNGAQQAANVSYQFTQNNYSPKALSRTDIYRQTKNQFTAMKGVIRA